MATAKNETKRPSSLRNPFSKLKPKTRPLVSSKSSKQSLAWVSLVLPHWGNGSALQSSTDRLQLSAVVRVSPEQNSNLRNSLHGAAALRFLGSTHVRCCC
eukprot:4489775-Amphidinium_carterae.1